MDDIRHYLESSTVHGLVYISTTKRFWRCFWTLIVITGFMTAGYLIQLSFKGWQDSPIKTTIETHPISEVTFPKITVCPPKDTYTNLNYDLINTDNKPIDYEKKGYLLYNGFIKHYQEKDFEIHKEKFENGFRVDKAYRNWYVGAAKW